jgi:hypothetical protein
VLPPPPLPSSSLLLCVKELISVIIKSNNEKLHILYSSQNVIRHMKPRRMRWVGHVARMAEEKIVQGFGGKAQRKEISW